MLYALIGAPVKWVFTKDARAQASKANFHFKDCTSIGNSPSKFAQIARKIFQVINARATVASHGALSMLYLSANHQYVVERCSQGVTYICVLELLCPLSTAHDFFKAVRKRADYVLKFLQAEQSAELPKPNAKKDPVHRQYMQCLQKNLQVSLWKRESETVEEPLRVGNIDGKNRGPSPTPVSGADPLSRSRTGTVEDAAADFAPLTEEYASAVPMSPTARRNSWSPEKSPRHRESRNFENPSKSLQYPLSPGGTKRLQRLEIRVTLPFDNASLGVLFGLQEPSRATTRDGRKTFPRLKVILLKRDAPDFEPGPLEQAGILVGDVLETVDSVPIRKFDDLHGALRAAKSRASEHVLTRAAKIMVLICVVLRRFPESPENGALLSPSSHAPNDVGNGPHVRRSTRSIHAGVAGWTAGMRGSPNSLSSTDQVSDHAAGNSGLNSQMPSWASGRAPPSPRARSVTADGPAIGRSASFSTRGSPPLDPTRGIPPRPKPRLAHPRQSEGGSTQYHSLPGRLPFSDRGRPLPLSANAARKAARSRIHRMSADAVVNTSADVPSSGSNPTSPSDAESEDAHVVVAFSSDDEWPAVPVRTSRSLSDGPKPRRVPGTHPGVVPKHVNLHPPDKDNREVSESAAADNVTKASGVGILIYTFDQGDVASHDMQKDVLSCVGPAALEGLQAKISDAKSGVDLQDIVHEFQPILSHIKLPPPTAVTLKQALKDAAREKIVLNGFQYDSVEALVAALERDVSRLVAAGGDATTLAHDILRAASRTISGHDSYSACFQLFAICPDYILVPGDVEAPPILIDTMNHGEGVIKIETVASYELQKRNEETDDLDTWLVLESTITDTLRIFDSAKDRVLCITEGSATPARNAYLVEGASEQYINGKYIRTATANLQGAEAAEDVPARKKGHRRSRSSSKSRSRSSSGMSLGSLFPATRRQSDPMKQHDSDRFTDKAKHGSPPLHSASPGEHGDVQAMHAPDGATAVRRTKNGSTYRNVVTQADLQQFFETSKDVWLPVAFLDANTSPNTTPTHKRNALSSVPSASVRMPGLATPATSPTKDHRKAASESDISIDEKLLRCRWVLRNSRGAFIYATGSTLLSEEELHNTHQRPPRSGWFALDPSTGQRSEHVGGKPAVPPTVSVFVLPVHRLVKHKQPAMTKMPDCGVCGGRIWSVKMWSCKCCNAKFHYKPSGSLGGKRSKRIGKCQAAAAQMVCEEAVRRREASSSAIARMHVALVGGEDTLSDDDASARPGMHVFEFAGHSVVQSRSMTCTVAGHGKSHSAPNTLNAREVDFLSSRRISDGPVDDMLMPTVVSGGTARTDSVAKVDHFDFVDGIDLASLGLDPTINTKKREAARAAASAGPATPSSTTEAPHIRRSSKSDPGTGALAKISMRAVGSPSTSSSDIIATSAAGVKGRSPRRNESFGARFVKAQENFERMIATPEGAKVRVVYISARMEQDENG